MAHPDNPNSPASLKYLDTGIPHIPNLPSAKEVIQNTPAPLLLLASTALVTSISSTNPQETAVIRSGITLPLTDRELLLGTIFGIVAGATEVIQSLSVKNLPQILGNVAIGFLFGAAAGNMVTDLNSNAAEAIKDHLTVPTMILTGYAWYRTKIGNKEERAIKRQLNEQKQLHKQLQAAADQYVNSKLTGDRSGENEAKNAITELAGGREEAKPYIAKLDQQAKQLAAQSR